MLQQTDDVDGGRLADIVDIALVRHARHMDLRSLHGLRGVVQGALHAFDHVVGHLAVDVSRQFNEAGFDAGLLGLPGEVERVDRNAVPAKSGPRVEWLEAEGLGGGGVDHFPDVDPHTVAHHGELVHQADVDHPVSVLEQLHHLGDAGGADRHHSVQRLGIERRACFGAGGRDAADDLGDVLGLVLRIARIDALGREAEEEILAALEPGPFEHGQQEFLGGAGIGGRFEDHQQSGV